LKITLNLEEALRYLRDENKERILWVYAICINQAEDAVYERNTQVQRMRLGYERATRVVAWLGPETENSGLAMALIAELKLKGFAQGAVMESLQDALELQKWKALFDLSEMEYWSRVWTVQKVVWACSIVLKFGANEIDWEDFSTGARTIYDVHPITLLAPEIRNGLYNLMNVNTRRVLRDLIQAGGRGNLLDLLSMTR